MWAGLNSPRSMGVDGNELPSAREISNRLFRAPGDATEADQTQSLMVMAWGQFIDHDLAATPVTQGKMFFFKNIFFLYILNINMIWLQKARANLQDS